MTCLIADPEIRPAADYRRSAGHARLLVEELAGEIEALADDAAVMAALRRHKRRETLRIAYGDLIRGQRLTS